jgi:germination protein M
MLLVVVIFLFNQKSIRDILEKTGFSELFKRDQEEEPEVTIITDEIPAENTGGDSEQKEIVIEVEKPEEIEESPAAPESEEEIPEKPHVRYANIYFVELSSDGDIELKAVLRSVFFSASPLRETLLVLLEGESRAEMTQGLHTQIPKDTELRNVYVKDGTAFIDFSENFLFNPLGAAGLETQLKQVVYTTLEFTNIEDVQILIEGKIKKYLSPEGIFVGKPLSKSAFI